jgi:hypothetical protein
MTMRSPQTVPLVIQHRALARPSSSIPIPTPASPAGSGRYHTHLHEHEHEEDIDMEADDSDIDSPPPLTTSQSLDDGDHLLTPPSHLLFGGPLTPVHALKGQDEWLGEGGMMFKGNITAESKTKSEKAGKGIGKEEDGDMQEMGMQGSALLQAPPEVSPILPFTE